MEVRVNEIQIPERIEFNYEELKAELIAKAETYETLVYTDEQIREGRADRAKLNKLKTALNDERIRREREYMEPFNVFKEQVNDLIKIIDKPIAAIDKQLKGYEEKKKADKRVEIGSMWSQLPDKPDWMVLKQIWDDRWLNASTNERQIKDNMTGWINKVNADIQTLEALPEFSFEAIEEYKRTLDLNRAIAEGKRLADIQKRKAEQEKARAEAEQRRKEEEERRKAEAEMAKHMTPPEVPEQPITAETPEEPKVEPKMEPEKFWVSFRCRLTVDEAKNLRAFFQANNIYFEAINA